MSMVIIHTIHSIHFFGSKILFRYVFQNLLHVQEWSCAYQIFKVEMENSVCCLFKKENTQHFHWQLQDLTFRICFSTQGDIQLEIRYWRSSSGKASQVLENALLPVQCTALPKDSDDQIVQRSYYILNSESSVEVYKAYMCRST